MRHNKSQLPEELLLILELLYRNTKRIMAQIDDLKAAQAAEAADVAQLKTDVANGIAVLQAAILAAQNSNPAVDLTDVIAASAAIDASIKGVDATVVAATATPVGATVP